MGKIKEGISQFGFRYLIRVISWQFSERIFRYEDAYLLAADTIESKVVPPSGITFRLANSDDAESFTPVRISSANVRHRLQVGDQCAIAIRDGKIIAMLWGAVGKLYLHEAGTLIDTGSNAFYRYNSFTVPEERLKGLYSQCSQILYEYFRAHGRTRVYGAISVFNLPSITASTSVGNKIVGESVLFSIFGLKILFYKHWPHPVKRLVIFTGKPKPDLRVI